MPDRSCPSCGLEVAAHQTLCPSCRAPVPSEAGPVATSSTAFTFRAPPPRAARPAAPAPPVTRPAPAAGASTTGALPMPGPPPLTGAAPDTAPGPGIAGPGREAMAAMPSVAPHRESPPAGAPPRDAVPWAAPAAGPARPSAGTLGVPGAPALDERGNLPAGLLGLAGAALVAAGVFLPWMEVDGQDVSGWAASGDAQGLLALAASATVVAALLIGGARSLLLRAGIAGLGALGVGLGAFEITSVGALEVDASVGRGLPVVIAGGVAWLAAGALTRHRRFR